MGMIKEQLSPIQARLDLEFTQAFQNIRPGLIIALAVTFGALYWLKSFRSAPSDDGKFTDIRRAPYNIPLIGHVWAFLWDLDGFLRSNRDASPHGIFALSMFGVNTNIIHSPSLMKQFFAQPNSVIEHKTLGANISTKIFAFPKHEVQLLITCFDELMNTITKHLMKEPGLEQFWKILKKDIELQIPEMVDLKKTRHSWERTSNTIIRPNEMVETSLFPMVRNCMGSMSSRVLMGSDLCDSHLNLLEDIWKIDANIMGFIFGFPSFLPPMSSAYPARKRLLMEMTAWHQRMEEESLDSPRFEDLSDLMKARQRIYSARGFSLVGRASIDMSILWALNANSNSVAYWLIRNIHANNLLHRVRAEIAPFVYQAPGRELQIETDDLLTRCPLFKSCYWESLRLDSGPWSFKRLQKDCVVDEAAEDCRLAPQLNGGPNSDSFFGLHRADCVLIPADLHHTDPRCWDQPERFIPERFISRQEDGTDVSEIKTIRPYGGGATICKGRLLAEKEVLTFVAGVLMCWDIQPVSPVGWAFPGRQKTSGVTSPKTDIRVLMTNRKW